jgi:hypothetical protein
MVLPPPPKNFSSAQENHINHLMAQREHLLVLQNYHFMWRTNTDNPEIASLHASLADLLEQATAQYETLVSTLRK